MDAGEVHIRGDRRFRGRIEIVLNMALRAGDVARVHLARSDLVAHGAVHIVVRDVDRARFVGMAVIAADRFGSLGVNFVESDAVRIGPQRVHERRIIRRLAREAVGQLMRARRLRDVVQRVVVADRFRVVEREAHALIQHRDVRVRLGIFETPFRSARIVRVLHVRRVLVGIIGCPFRCGHNAVRAVCGHIRHRRNFDFRDGRDRVGCLPLLRAVIRAETGETAEEHCHQGDEQDRPQILVFRLYIHKKLQPLKEIPPRSVYRTVPFLTRRKASGGMRRRLAVMLMSVGCSLYASSLIAACAAASLAMGTRNGLQET